MERVKDGWGINEGVSQKEKKYLPNTRVSPSSSALLVIERVSQEGGLKLFKQFKKQVEEQKKRPPINFTLYLGPNGRRIYWLVDGRNAKGIDQ